MNQTQIVSESHLYGFASSNSQVGTYNVTVTEQASNSTPTSFELVNDETAPTVTINVSESSGLGVPVSWEGLDIFGGSCFLGGARHWSRDSEL